MKDTREELSTLTVGLHWLVAAAIIGMLAFGLYIDSLERSPERGALMDLHKSIGVTILALACLRILWRWRNGMPVMLGRAPRWHKVAAHAVHGIADASNAQVIAFLEIAPMLPSLRTLTF